MNMPRRLPTVQIGGKEYFVDERLNELRNVNNPHDRKPIDEAYDEFVEME